MKEGDARKLTNGDRIRANIFELPFDRNGVALLERNRTWRRNQMKRDSSANTIGQIVRTKRRAECRLSEQDSSEELLPYD